MYTENYDPFMADFGQPVRVGSIVVNAIFDNAESDSFGIVANSRPMLTVATKDIPCAAIGTAVMVGTTQYTIAELQPDGTGVTLVMLK